MSHQGQSFQDLINDGVENGVDGEELKRMLSAIKIAPELENCLKQ